jgi:hypothetical protein
LDETCSEVPLDAIPLFQVQDIKINDCEGVGRDCAVDQGLRSGNRKQSESIRISCDELKKAPNNTAVKTSSQGIKNQRSFLKDIGRAIGTTSLSNAASLNKTKIEAEQHKTLSAMNRTIEVKTDVDGYNSGRIYFIRMSSEEECLRIARLLSDLSKRSRRLCETQTRLQVLSFILCS